MSRDNPNETHNAGDDLFALVDVPIMDTLDLANTLLAQGYCPEIRRHVVRLWHRLAP